MTNHANFYPGKPSCSLKIRLLSLVLGCSLCLAAPTMADTHDSGSWTIDSKGIFQTAVHNPQPDLLPSMSIRRPRETDFCVVISMTFPGVPGLVCDAWCFEGELVTFSSARELDGGGLEVRHRVNNNPTVLHVMTLKPGKGAVEFQGRIEIDNEQAGSDDGLTADDIHITNVPNICFQVKRSPSFQSAPENMPRCSSVPEHARNYWDNFVSRCFIFTGEGMTFLDKTSRTDTARDHNFPQDDPRNKPPAVQRYYGVWQSFPKGEGTSSLTRYTLPLIGTISRDGKYLVAGTDSQTRFISQAWLDCFHIYSKWSPADQPASRRSWRMKLYAMENDPEALLTRVAGDFPGIDKLDDKPVPIH
jgi:hypothetical protein